MVPGWDYSESPHPISGPTTILLITAATIGPLLHLAHLRERVAAFTVKRSGGQPAAL